MFQRGRCTLFSLLLLSLCLACLAPFASAIIKPGQKPSSKRKAASLDRHIDAMRNTCEAKIRTERPPECEARPDFASRLLQ